MQPNIIQGGSHADERGIITYNNSFDAGAIKRIYFIENIDIDFQRGWQGHKIEQRWFVATAGDFEITLITLENWEDPNPFASQVKFELTSSAMNVLHVPSGYISKIKALKSNSKLMAMSDYGIGEIQDEYRFPLEKFKTKHQ